MEALTRFFVSLMEAEAKKSPGVVLVVCAVFLLGVGFLVGNPFAMAEDVKEFRDSALKFREATKEELDGVKARLGKVEIAVCETTFATRTSGLEQMIRGADAEIFQLERMEKAGEARERDITRLSNLRTDRAKLLRELDRLQRDTDCDANR